jgi:hypothetical protein
VNFTHLWKKKRDAPGLAPAERRVGRLAGDASPLPQELKLYDALRGSVPVIDAALNKIVRLVGGFTVTCRGPGQKELDEFVREVPVGGAGKGLEAFLSCYLDNLLTYGNAVGEILLTPDGRRVAGLYNGDLQELDIRRDEGNPLGRRIFLRDGSPEGRAVQENGRILFTALNPRAGEVTGSSLLKGLPFVAGVLLKIFECTGLNFERAGNIRYAVTYRPGPDSLDQAYARERAAQIAKEWSSGMTAARNGMVTDFVSVGDVEIKTIGADCPIPGTEIPVRQMLEQIIAKLGIPPFLLGLSWSTTERMSKQQADILTSELACYRRLMNPVLAQICRTFLRLEGLSGEPEVQWSIINLQDEGEMARARLYNAQAAVLEKGQAKEDAV